MTDTIQPLPMAIITRDIEIGGVVVFKKGEQVVIEKVEPNPQRPECKYVVKSASLQRKFQLSDLDINILTNSLNAGALTPNREMKKCPYCAELINNEAIKCRFCGATLVKYTKAGKVHLKTNWPSWVPLAIKIVVLVLIIGGIAFIPLSFYLSSTGRSNESALQNQQEAQMLYDGYTSGVLTKQGLAKAMPALVSEWDNKTGKAKDFDVEFLKEMASGNGRDLPSLWKVKDTTFPIVLAVCAFFVVSATGIVLLVRNYRRKEMDG